MYNYCIIIINYMCNYTHIIIMCVELCLVLDLNLIVSISIFQQYKVLRLQMNHLNHFHLIIPIGPILM